VFWVISVYFNIRNTLPKFCPFPLGHSVYISLLAKEIYRTIDKDKVKCRLVQALRLCTGHMAHRGSRGIALLFYDHGTRRG